MLASYLEHSPRSVTDITTAINDANIAALGLAAHSLKSSSANVGARRMAELSRRLEALADAGDLEAATSPKRRPRSRVRGHKCALELEPVYAKGRRPS